MVARNLASNQATETTGITTALSYNIELGVGGGGSINGMTPPFHLGIII